MSKRNVPKQRGGVMLLKFKIYVPVTHFEIKTGVYIISPNPIFLTLFPFFFLLLTFLFLLFPLPSFSPLH